MPILIVLAVGFFGLVLLVAVFTKTRCDLCSTPFQRKRYRWEINGEKKTICPNCSRRLQNEASKQATRRLLGAASGRPKATAVSKPLALSDILAKLESAKGTATRRRIVQEALPKFKDEDLKQQLLLESSRIEVEAVLEKVDGLKSDAGKKRNLEAALEAIRADPVPDELQAAEILLLEKALADLDAPSS